MAASRFGVTREADREISPQHTARVFRPVLRLVLSRSRRMAIRHLDGSASHTSAAQ